MSEPQKTVAATTKPKAVDLMPIQAVYGLMIHPYTQARFDQGKVLDHVVDDWVKTQLDAGKLIYKT